MDAFIPPARPHHPTEPIQHSPIIRERNLRLAIAAVKAVEPDDMVLVMATMMMAHTRLELDAVMSQAERLMRSAEKRK